MESPTLIFLEQVKDNLNYVDYDLIYQSISDMKYKFIPTAILNKGWYIDRVRINEPNEIFTSIDQVSLFDYDRMHPVSGHRGRCYHQSAV